LGVVVLACNPSTQEAEAGGSLVQVQLGLHRKTLSQNSKMKQNEQMSKQKKNVLVLSLLPILYQ
jgi:hypothetical protein